MYAQLTRGGLRRANCAAHPPVSRSVSYLLISRSHPALTPPPARNPAHQIYCDHNAHCTAEPGGAGGSAIRVVCMYGSPFSSVWRTPDRSRIGSDRKVRVIRGRSSLYRPPLGWSPRETRGWGNRLRAVEFVFDIHRVLLEDVAKDRVRTCLDHASMYASPRPGYKGPCWFVAVAIVAPRS